jgi:hypothetical protein
MFQNIKTMGRMARRYFDHKGIFRENEDLFVKVAMAI